MSCILCGAERGPFHHTIKDRDIHGYAYWFCCKCRADRPINLVEACKHL